MAKPFKTLLEQMSPERRERITDRAQDLLIEMALHELRQTRNLTQQQVADALGISQAALSKMERQTDIQVSTLRRILSAMGGELKLVAHFPDGEFVISPPMRLITFQELQAELGIPDGQSKHLHRIIRTIVPDYQKLQNESGHYRFTLEQAQTIRNAFLLLRSL